MNTNKARNQITKLYFIDGIGGLMIAGASWVALLAARGFSTVEIGLFESIFHVASMIFEVPSGAAADVFGRKKVMITASVMTIISSILMIFTNTFAGISVAMVFSALSYNLASGTREALAYDSLKEAGIENEYSKFASNDMVIYRLTSSLGTLMAGIALMLGYKKANALDILMAIAAILIGTTLMEPKSELSHHTSVSARFKEVALESVRFIKENRKARLIIIFNAFIGAVATLIVFFLQAKLPQLGIKTIWLGPALFSVGLGSVIGAKAIEYCTYLRYKYASLFAVIGIAIAFGSIFTGSIALTMLGAFVGGFADSFIEVRSDVVLNNMIPSSQRATLMSINSFTFSVIMIILSPVFGWIFS
ncbi:MFS transporter [Pseudobutyrivibrio xylanivorans]|uniref:Major Facilitator Superfamily protein n=1 Tax=Pseudobutyrivibrio xylanivorans DSM 14809 TaxID=1123012 RepID=A0A1M6GEX7_PSEXY|nr:MFS transporter [Pseudobutyrivibrio xylanivorans]SHJ08502.1 Major Facilitator Superfamily protein [Pseudobutyrivibrio xylanivorans DSM 14809]